MIKRLYIDNYRCFRNFELKLGAIPCAMLIGGNGVGKSTVGEILSAFRKIGVGETRVNSVFPSGSKSGIGMAGGMKSDSVRIELDVTNGEHTWAYGLTLLWSNSTRYSVSDETLGCDGMPLFVRSEMRVRKDILAIGCVADVEKKTEIADFLKMLASILVIRPAPSTISGLIHHRLEYLAEDCRNFADWFTAHISGGMASYMAFQNYLKCVMEDFSGTEIGECNASGPMLTIRFGTAEKGTEVRVPFGDLSDGEKCQLIAASVVALNETTENLSVFWDEPDNYITTAEVAYLMPALCHSFVEKGQLIVSSHSREAILTYGENEVLCLRRGGHGMPVKQPVSIAELRDNKVVTGSFDQVLRSGEAVTTWD